MIEAFLNNATLRTELGVPSISQVGNFSSCSSDVGAGFRAHMDKYAVPAQNYVAELLARGVRMLIYAGTYDWQCNWVANKLWVEHLPWEGKDAYNAKEWRVWNAPDGSEAGITKSEGALTFASVVGAGHMVSFLLVAGTTITDFSRAGAA